MDIICHKCGHKAFSKCPTHRSIFPNDASGEVAEEIGDVIMTYYIKESDSGLPKVVIPKDALKDPEQVRNIIGILKQTIRIMEDDVRRNKFFCDHEWNDKEGNHYVSNPAECSSCVA